MEWGQSLARGIVAFGVTLGLGCAVSAAAVADPHGGGGPITLGGRVGPLMFDHSTAQDVMAFAGQPDATGSGNFSAIPRDPDYVALGYVCQEQRARGLIRIDSFDYCSTAFYINSWTQRLVGFRSMSWRYSMRGASPGMSTRAADRHIHRLAHGGCLGGFFLGWRGHYHASFWGEVEGGRAAGRKLVIHGGQLTSLNLESNRYPVGLLFC
jgi:hypothetical protein